MPMTKHALLFALLPVLAATVLGACREADEGAGPATAATRDPATSAVPASAPAPGVAAPGGATTARGDCPTEAEVAEIMGRPVKQISRGLTCAYQAEDGSFDVTILISGAGAGDQLLAELRENAGSRPGAKVEPIPIGDRAEGYATPRQAGAAAVAGGRAYFIIVSHSSDPPGDPKGEVLKILKKMIG